MVEDLAQALLEIIINSVKANATKIIIKFLKSDQNNEIAMEVEDDGKGMDEESLGKATTPFYTERTTRKIGLGLPFFKGLAEMLNGTFAITSTPNIGTKVRLTVQKDHIDLPKQGDLGEMMMIAIGADPSVDYQFTYRNNDQEFIFKTEEVKEILQTDKIDDPEVLIWIREYIDQEIEGLNRR